MPLERLLVPLDGSELSQSVLVPVHRLLLPQGSGKVTLLEVVDTSKDVSSEGWERRLDEARQYLLNLKERLDELSLDVSVRLERGAPAERILSTSDEMAPDLIAMTTHARTGLPRLLQGSVAEEVLRSGTVPLLLCNEHGARAAGPNRPFHRILVPLDGSQEANEILPLVGEVALAHRAEVVLLRIDEQPLKAGTQRFQQIGGFLGHYADGLEERGVPRVQIVGSHGAPAERILEILEGERADLLAMSTHGRSGWSRVRFGSVAEEVLRRCPVPLLLRRAP